MIRKLLKYDLRYIYKVLGIYYLIAILCALVFIVTDIENSNGLVEFIHLFAGGCSFGLSIGIIINIITQGWRRFQKNFYGEEAYLTHTLPATKAQLLVSKMLATAITLIVSLVVLTFCMITTQVGFSELGTIDELLRADGHSLIGLGALLFITVGLEEFFIIECGFTSILIGHRKDERRGLWSSFAGVALYLGISALLIGGALLWSLADSSISNALLGGAEPDLSTIYRLSIGVDLAYTVIIVVLYFVSQRIFERGVDVE